MANILKQNHPKGLYLLFAVEMWERFSYYGMRALLVLYMVKYLLFNTHKAGQIYGMYTGFVYLTPLIGGYLADRYLGARKAIFIGALLMVLGHFTMAFSDLPCFYTALILLIIGNGFFKPNIATVVGQLYEKDDPRRDGGFTIFYMGINIGALLSPLICGTLGEKIGFHYGFAAAGVGMLIGLLLYKFGEKKYLEDKGLFLQDTSDEIKQNKPLTKYEKQHIAVIFVLMFFSMFFWASFEQAGSSLTLFADRSTDRIIPFLNMEMPVTYFQALNPLFIIILAPLFSRLWMSLANKRREPSVFAKFAFGLGFVAFGFVIMVIASYFAEYDKVSILWLLSVYLFHTMGELCLSPVGTSTVTKLAPIQFASLLMGVWYLSSFFANLASGIFAGNYDDIDNKIFFLIPVLMASISAVILFLLNNKLKKWI